MTDSVVSHARGARRKALALCVLLTMLSSASTAWALPILPGDINLDGKVNVSDVQCHVLATANPDEPPECMKASPEDADVSCDGQLNVSDLQLTVLLAVGNPLSTVVDQDGDTRVDNCDPDRDGDSWSDDCESAAGTAPDDPNSHPNAASECAGSTLSTACRLSGQAGDLVRCDITLARESGTLAASGLSTIVQVDPSVASLEQVDTVRTCAGDTCSYGGQSPPSTTLESGAALALSPTCDIAPCTLPWAQGKLGVSLGAAEGPMLSDAIWPSPGVSLEGDGFLVSVVAKLESNAEALAVEVFDGRAQKGDDAFSAGLRATAAGAALVTNGPPAGTPCTIDTDCDDGDPCTTDTCVGGTCDALVNTCDDGLTCTTDSCGPGGCIVALESDHCVLAGSCLPASDPSCQPLVRLSEVSPMPGESWIELVHEGPATIRLTGFSLSTGGAPWPVPPLTVPPFGTVSVYTGSGEDTGLNVYTEGTLGSLSWDGGEVVLWRDGVIADYVGWGVEGHPTLEIAGAAGAWSHGYSLVVDAVPPGYTLHSTASGGASGWNAAEASPNAGSLPCALIDCVEVACHESEDGDFDGAADCEDSDCATADGCDGDNVEICDDGVDNDNNGLADCLDPDCALVEACPAQPILNEVVFDPEGQARIELTNLDVAPIALESLVLCSQSACTALASGSSLYPASFVTVHTGMGQDTVTERWLGGALGPLNPAEGELVLSASDPPTNETIHSYVRWSRATNAATPEESLEALAVDASKWAPSSRIYTDALRPGDAIARDPNGTGLAWEWDLHVAPSIGQGNPNCGTPGQCRESRCEDATDEDGDGGFDCADADCDGWPTCEVRLVLNEIRLTGPEGSAVELSNLGAAAASLSDRSLISGGQALPLGDAGSLGPGDVLVLRSGTGEATEGTLYLLPHELESTGGELALEHGTLTDYVRWVVGASAQEDEAAAANQWLSGESVSVDAMDVGSQTLAYDGYGERASDWVVSSPTLGAPNAIEFGLCGDGIDNDDDGLLDCWDDDCAASEFCDGELCGNGLDDDNNGATDCEDTFCQDKGPCLEVGQCGDGVDNDLDGLTDCVDVEDCADAQDCDEAFHCGDGIDNDLDGLTDCADDACEGAASCLETGNCDDGIDNDFNGLTDCEEPSECGAEIHCLEALNCADGVDNDLDGLTDCDDLENCEGQVGCVEIVCDDLVDDDGDGDVDCDDEECALLPICVGAEPEFTLTEVYLSSPLDTHVIELGNIGPATGNAAGLILCAGAECVTLPEDFEVKPGEFLLLETGEGEDFEGQHFIGDGLSGLSVESGALALYAPIPAEGPEALLDYVQWGNGEHPAEDLAVSAGQWVADESIPSASYLPGLTSYTWLGTGEGASHWAVHFTPSPGATNPDCSLPGACAELDCRDGEDNDGDTFIDCLDGDCQDLLTCSVEADHCDDTLDNDGDGLVDCQDAAECADAPACDEALHCSDFVDNDYNGKADCEDPACTGHPTCSEGLNCADQVDNDKDGLYDCEDPECANDSACRETDAECGDLYDNDLDGAIDCADSDCTGSAFCLEQGQCWDGIDNDANGLTDCLDDACRMSESCAPRVRLTEIAFDGEGEGTIEIGNPGREEAASALLWVCVNETCVQIPEYVVPLPAGSTLSLHSSAGEEIAGHQYLDAPWGLDIAGGSARLYGATDAAGEPTWLLDYVAWGSPGQVGEDEAIATGRWPIDIAVPTDDLAIGRSLGRYGVTHEPWRWAVWNEQSVTDGGQLACQPELCKETWCGDGHDNDNDDLLDCLDPDCEGAAACIEAGHCDDGEDNDDDGVVDCYDSECASAPACAQAARFSELILDAEGGGDIIELVNPFSSPLSLGGTQLCASSTACYTLPTGLTLPGEGRLAIHAGEGSGEAAALQAGDSLGDLSPEGGVLTLSAGPDPSDWTSLIAFVDWGRQGGALHQAAVRAGLWRLGDRIETTAFVSGFDSLISDSSQPSADAWSIATSATPAEANVACSEEGSCRETRCFDGVDEDADGLVDCEDDDCSLVQGCAARIVLNELHFGDGSAEAPAWIELANLGTAPESLVGWSICGGALCHVIGEGELQGGSLQALVLGEGNDNGALAFIGDDLGLLDPAGGSLALHRPSENPGLESLVDYVAWGSPALEPDDEVAVAAGQWLPGARLQTAGLGPQESLHYGGLGEGAHGWTIAPAPSAANANQNCLTLGNCRELRCGDRVDEDLDGLVDCADPDCRVVAACDESLHCDNGEDEDHDGLFDCMDIDCFGAPACQESSACEDISDNDLDGFVDCGDVECKAKPHCDESLRCDDGIDNDDDGTTDCQDTSCAGTASCPESSHCGDEVDNDLDGLVDCLDPDCEGIANCDESNFCGDELDNDLDGMTDCSDSECAGIGACAEGNACVEEDFIPIACGGQTGGFLLDAEEWDAAGACGVTQPGPAALYKMTAPCDSRLGFVLKQQKTELINIIRLDGICHTASWCEWAGGVDYEETDCPGATADETCTKMEFDAVAGATYYFILQRDQDSADGGDFGILTLCSDCAESACDDGTDNDLDTLIDCDDPDCGCSEAGACDNGIDDDGDGATDCADDICIDHPVCDEASACQDGVDQDGDGLVDCADPDCPHYPGGALEGFCDASESPNAPHTGDSACSDGIDNDGDVLSDCQDADCATHPDCTEVDRCDDTLDNNEDGLTDCSDASCALDPACAGGTPCSHHALLSCGDSVTHDPMVVGSDVLAGDYCGHSGAHAGSHEVIYKVAGPCEGTLRATLSHGATGTYTLSALEGVCRSTAHCASPPRSVETDGAAVDLEWPVHSGVDTYLVVEGHAGTTGDYTLSLVCVGCPEGACGDTIDNDGDGQTDCEDSDCDTVSPCATESACADGVDEDLDGVTDCDDVDCAGQQGCHYACLPLDFSCGASAIVDLSALTGVTDIISSYGCAAHDYTGSEHTLRIQAPSACSPTVSLERITPDEGRIDILGVDPSAPACSPETCGSAGEMGAEGRAQLSLAPSAPGQPHLVTLDGREGYEGMARVAVSCCAQAVEDFCHDGVDGDADGLTDCADPDCQSLEACLPETNCSNGLDDDDDGLSDCEDPDCTTSPLCTELLCADGQDSDGDTLTDCEDPDCAGTLDCTTPCTTYQEIGCGVVMIDQATEEGQSVFSGYDCAPEATCNDGGYSTAEQSYVVVPTCDTEISVQVNYEGGHEAFFAAYLGQSCDEALQSCGETCSAPASASVGSASSPALLSFSGSAGKAHWFNVESAAAAGAEGTTFSLGVQCSCP